MITGKDVLALALPHRLPLNEAIRLIESLDCTTADQQRLAADLARKAAKTNDWVFDFLFGESWEESQMKTSNACALRKQSEPACPSTQPTAHNVARALIKQEQPRSNVHNDLFERCRHLRQRCYNAQLHSQEATRFAKSLYPSKRSVHPKPSNLENIGRQGAGLFTITSEKHKSIAEILELNRQIMLNNEEIRQESKFVFRKLQSSKA